MTFEGYGPDSPNVVFVGLEEYCSADPTQQRDSIYVRCNSPVFEGRRVDKNAALKELTGLVKTAVPVWELMAAIMAGLGSGDHALEWELLGARSAAAPLTSLLTELRPLPRPGVSAFRGSYIEEWFDFDSKAHYEKVALKAGAVTLRRALLGNPPPRYAFFYGLPASDWARTNLRAEMNIAFQERDDDGIEVGVTTSGTVVALTGFYNGQHAATAFRPQSVPRLLLRLREHQIDTLE